MEGGRQDIWVTILASDLLLIGSANLLTVSCFTFMSEIFEKDKLENLELEENVFQFYLKQVSMYLACDSNGMLTFDWNRSSLMSSVRWWTNHITASWQCPSLLIRFIQGFSWLEAIAFRSFQVWVMSWKESWQLVGLGVQHFLLGYFNGKWVLLPLVYWTSVSCYLLSSDRYHPGQCVWACTEGSATLEAPQPPNHHMALHGVNPSTTFELKMVTVSFYAERKRHMLLK